MRIFGHHTSQPYIDALYGLYKKGLKEVVVSWEKFDDEEDGKNIIYTEFTSIANYECDKPYDYFDDEERIIKFAEDTHDTYVIMRLTLDENRQLHIERITKADLDAYIERLRGEENAETV